MHKQVLAIAGVAIALWGAAPVTAQTVEARNPASVQAALQNGGYKPEMKKDASGDPMLMIDSQGYKMMVLFFGCKNNTGCKSVSFYAATRAAKKIDLAAVNKWNEQRRFGRAFLDSEGDPSLQFDVNLDVGGMSPALFIDTLEWFTVAFDNLKTEMAK
jgi:hypothetical protein